MILIDETKKQALLKAQLKPLSTYQFAKALNLNGLDTQIKSKLSELEDQSLALAIQFELDKRPTFERESETITYMSNLLGLTEDQVDSMWQQAMTY